MWLLLLTWMSLQSSETAQFNSKILYSYDTKEDCEWAREWVLENNEPSQNPTMQALCVQKSHFQSNEDSQSSPAQQ
jgi:hypothetical protein